MTKIYANIGEVAHLSNRLNSTSHKISDGLDYLEKAVEGTNTAWQDEVGENFVNELKKFIKDSKEIAVDVYNASKKVSKKANHYNDAYNEALKGMRG